MNDIGDAFFWKRKRDNVCNWMSYFSFIVATHVSPSANLLIRYYTFWIRCCPMELSVTRGGEMQREGPGKWLLPWCLSPSSSSTVSSYGLFSAMEAEVAGAQCQVLSSFTGPGVQVKASDGGVYLCFFHNTFLKLSWPCSRTYRTRKSVHWVLDSEARMRQDVAEWQDTKGKHGTS